MEECPLCYATEALDYSKDKFRQFKKCQSCSLIYVPRAELITSSAEKERYDSHQNDEQDEGYLQYLKGIADSVNLRLPQSSSGLDFGCGRTTILADQLSKLGHTMNSYDVYFLDDGSVWNKRYDFIILSEVIEHLREPRKESGGR